VVIDIGANIGYFSLLAASKVAPAGRVLAFEPVPSIADLLERNIRDNSLPVDVFRLALGEAEGEIEIFRATDTNIGKSGTSPDGGAICEGKVRRARAADVIPRALWARIRLIKIDVEGDEASVLAGLLPVLEALPDGAAVQVEINPDALAARGTSPAAILAQMADGGFHALSVHNSYHPNDYAAGTVSRPRPLTSPPTKQTDAIFVKQRA
jgi:FkbM family methyltransferase